MSIKDDAIDALVALGHKRAEAMRLVETSLARGADPNDVQSIITGAYAKPRASGVFYQALYSEYYRGSANFAGEHSELMQIAKAVGPGLSEREFEALAKRVEDVQAQRGQMTTKAYQAALWAIPEAFAADRRAPVHFQPQRDKSGKPVETKLEPIPPKAVEGLGTAEASAGIAPDALASLVRPAAQNPSSPIDVAGVGRSPSAPAAPADDIGNPARPVTPSPTSANVGQVTVPVPAPIPPSASAIAGMMGKPAAEFKIWDTVVTHGDKGQQIAGAIKGTTSSGKFVIDTPTGSVARSRGELEHYKPLFNAGDAVHLPRYASDSGGMGRVIAKNPDGTFSVEINGRGLGSVPASDMQSPEGLEKTPREQPSAFTFAGAENAPDLSAALSGLLNRPADDNKTATPSSALDKAQMVADAVGVVDQSGLTDLGNAGVSLTRAFTEPDRAGEHLADAGMRALSAIPLVGDAAKLVKYGGKGAEAMRGGKAAHHLLKGGETEAKASGRAIFGNGVDAAAQAALRLVSGGSGGGGGGNGNAPPSGDSGDAADPQKVGEDAKQAAKDIATLGDSIEKFLNGMGAAGAALAYVGSQVYERALKPMIDWFKQVDATSKAMLEDNRKLAAYSGELSAAMQRLDTERFLRDVTKAQEMSGSIARLAGAQSRSEQAQQDLTQPYQQLGVELQAFRTEVVAYIMRTIDSIDFIGGLIDWWIGDQKMKDALRNDMERAEQMLDEHLAERKLKK